ncbi:MAG: hypothetical protein AAF355_10800 [Myxococcota bacterium]
MHNTFEPAGRRQSSLLSQLLVFGLTFALGFGLLQARVAEAQFTSREEVEATPKGTIGLAMIGAEVGLAVPALAGLDQPWALTLFPILGGAGGALGGYYGIDNNDSEGAAVAVLAIGFALLVPTVIITIGAIAYDPDDERSDTSSSSPSGAQPGDPDYYSKLRRLQRERVRRDRLARAGSGLVRFSEEGILLGPPGFEVQPIYSMAETQRYGVGGNAVQFSLLTGAF